MDKMGWGVSFGFNCLWREINDKNDSILCGGKKKKKVILITWSGSNVKAFLGRLETVSVAHPRQHNTDTVFEKGPDVSNKLQ